MALNGITLMKGSTGATITGGTATVFSDDGLEVKNGIHLIDAAAAFSARSQITFRNRPPVLGPDGVWSKAKRMVVVATPVTKPDGTTGFRVFRGEVEFFPEICTSTDVVSLYMLGVQCFTDSESQNFVQAGGTV